MERRECETRYELAAAILPSRLRRIAMELPETDKRRAEEFRLRAGHCLSVLLPEGELGNAYALRVERMADCLCREEFEGFCNQWTALLEQEEEKTSELGAQAGGC